MRTLATLSRRCLTLSLVVLPHAALAAQPPRRAARPVGGFQTDGIALTPEQAARIRESTRRHVEELRTLGPAPAEGDSAWHARSEAILERMLAENRAVLATPAQRARFDRNARAIRASWTQAAALRRTRRVATR